MGSALSKHNLFANVCILFLLCYTQQFRDVFHTQVL